ncbi:MAG: hypothetical protein AB4050_17740 [Synechococcus sp.]
MKDFEARLNQANGRLKVSHVRVRIQQRNQRLYLRATLPPKPNSIRKKPYRQEIALGAKTTVAGVKYAEAEARKLAALLDCREFSWEPYITEEVGGRTVESWVEKFEVDYFTRRSRTPKTETT